MALEHCCFDANMMQFYVKQRKGVYKMKKRVISLFCAVLMLMAVCVPASATESPEAAITGDLNNEIIVEQGEHVHDNCCTEAVAVGETASPQNIICSISGHKKGTFLGATTDNTNIDINKYCYYRVTIHTYLCERCNAQFTDSQAPVYAVHDKEYSYQGTTIRGFYCKTCGYRSWA